MKLPTARIAAGGVSFYFSTAQLGILSGSPRPDPEVGLEFLPQLTDPLRVWPNLAFDGPFPNIGMGWHLYQDFEVIDAPKRGLLRSAPR